VLILLQFILEEKIVSMKSFFLVSLVIFTSSLANLTPIYDINLSWEENLNNLDRIAQTLPKTNLSQTRSKATINLFGYQLNSPIGISACPLTTSHGISVVANLGYDLITYKTIRSKKNAAYNFPNIVIIDRPEDGSQLSITNSFGINSACPNQTILDIAKSKELLNPGQLLMVSIYGEGETLVEQIQDFLDTAKLAVIGGADILEANLSCPNLGQEQAIYQSELATYEICKSITTKFPQIPLVIKVGCFTDLEQMKRLFCTAAKAGAKGICGINTVPVKVVDEHQAPVFKDREISGLSGSAIGELTLTFTKNARKIIDENQLDLKLITTGGITKWQNFDALLAAGADLVQSATGAMFNQNLALDYHQNHNLIIDLFKIGAIKMQAIQCKNGSVSPIYFDMRTIISYPEIFNQIAQAMHTLLTKTSFDLVCGVPYGAIPLASLTANLGKYSLIMPRKEIKAHGTKSLIEGAYQPQQVCAVIEDVVTSGSSILETIDGLTANGLIVKDVFVLIDREQNGVKNIQKRGYHVHTLFTITNILQNLLVAGLIDASQFATVQQFCANTPVDL